MTRKEFIAQATIAVLGGQEDILSYAGIVAWARALADELEQQDVAPWADKRGDEAFEQYVLAKLEKTS